MKLALSNFEGEIAGAATEAMRETMPLAKQELRDQITSSGLGQRLANTWRGNVYPQSRRSVNPAGYIYSNAPDIVDAFSRGATIRPLAGRRFLAIPTNNVPQTRARGARKQMTPEEVQLAFNQDLFFKRGPNGRVYAFVNAVQSRNRKSFKPSTKGRLAQGRAEKPVLMFVMVPAVRLPKLLDLDAVAAKWTSRFEASFAQRVEAP
nr:DUF6441 family protein [Sphingomonas jinjuensis]